MLYTDNIRSIWIKLIKENEIADQAGKNAISSSLIY